MFSIEMFKHNKEERIARTWGTTARGLPYVEQAIRHGMFEELSDEILRESFVEGKEPVPLQKGKPIKLQFGTRGDILGSLVHHHASQE
ncbi:ATP sulfurylase 4 [Nymphaea thermarum]|nr:ATP sulfurylase 4 [Nymphaea thermarum]